MSPKIMKPKMSSTLRIKRNTKGVNKNEMHTNAYKMSACVSTKVENINDVSNDPSHSLFGAKVGLDMSLRSPGCAIFLPNGNQWQLYGFAQVKKHENRSWVVNDRVTLALFGKIPEHVSDARRYLYIVQHLLAVIPRSSQIAIEGYAYPSNSAQRGFNFKLHELGGALKAALTDSGIENYTPVVASAWKKKVVGKGNATKLDVLEHVRKNEPHIDLLDILEMQLKKVKVKTCREDPNSDTDMDATLAPSLNFHPVQTCGANLTVTQMSEVPCPCQDLADAICICKFLLSS
jgi:Holliday junction resolvasome RuvABC endonuclease subunit